MKKIILLCILVCLVPSMVLAKREHPEKWYQEQWCAAHKGQVEVALPDGTRCDCVTKIQAIEFDFGNRWAEAVGQSAYYSMQTKKRPEIASPFTKFIFTRSPRTSFFSLVNCYKTDKKFI